MKIDAPPLQQTRRVLTRDRNQCPTCGHFFKSGAGFDKHRVGKFGSSIDGRRCLSEAEMLLRGMTLDSSGFWITRKRSIGAIPSEQKRAANHHLVPPTVQAVGGG
jgi:hypothetical protein